MTDWFRLKQTSESYLGQCACSSRATYSRLPRTMSRSLLNIPNKGHPKDIPEQFVLVLSHPHRKRFLMFRWNVLCFSLFTSLVVLFLDRVSFHFLFRYFYTVMSYPFEPSFLQAKCPQPFLLWWVSQTLYHFCQSFWTFMAGLFSVCPHLSCSEEPRTGHGTPDFTNAEWREHSSSRILG